MCMQSKESMIQSAMETAVKEQTRLLNADDRRKECPLSAARKRFFVAIAHWVQEEDLRAIGPVGFVCDHYFSVRNLIGDMRELYGKGRVDWGTRVWWEVSWKRKVNGLTYSLAKLALDADGTLLAILRDDGLCRLKQRERAKLLVNDSVFWQGEPYRRWYFS